MTRSGAWPGLAAGRGGCGSRRAAGGLRSALGASLSAAFPRAAPAPRSWLPGAAGRAAAQQEKVKCGLRGVLCSTLFAASRPEAKPRPVRVTVLLNETKHKPDWFLLNIYFTERVGAGEVIQPWTHCVAQSQSALSFTSPNSLSLLLVIFPPPPILSYHTGKKMQLQHSSLCITTKH